MAEEEKAIAADSFDQADEDRELGTGESEGFAKTGVLSKLVDFLIGDSSDSDEEIAKPNNENIEDKEKKSLILDQKLESALSETTSKTTGVYFSVLNSIIFLAFALTVNQVENVAEVTQAIRAELELEYWDVDEELQLFDINSISDIDKYVRRALLPTCYGGETFIRQYNFVVGLRFTFKRAHSIENTYDLYNDAVPWTLDNEFNPNSDSQDYEIKDMYGGIEYDETGGYRGEGGYVMYIYETGTNINNALREWRIANSLLMNRELLSLVVELVVHNRNLETTVYYFQEFVNNPGGAIETVTGSAGIFAESYEKFGARASTVLGLFIFYIIGLLFQIYESIQMWIRVLKVLWTQFKLEIEWYEYIEITSIILAITSIIFFSTNVLSYIGDFKVPVEDTDELDTIMDKCVNFRIFVRVSALTCLLLIIKAVVLLKSKFPSFGILFDTVRRANADILNFGFILIILLTAFALMGLICFGTQTQHYSSLGDSYFNLFIQMMGQLDYDTINNANPSLSDIYIIFFIVLFVFILINMFLAIVMSTYTELREQNQELLEAKAELLGEQVKQANKKWLNLLLCRVGVQTQEELAWDYYEWNQQIIKVSKEIEALTNEGPQNQEDQKNYETKVAKLTENKKALERSIADCRMTIIKSRSPSIFERIKANVGELTAETSSQLMTREQAKEKLKTTINLISERKRKAKIEEIEQESKSNYKYFLVKDMLIFLVFIIIFILMTLSRFRTENSFQIYSAMYDSLNNPEFNYNGIDMDFSQVDRAERAYFWIQSVLSPVVSKDYVYFENRLVGNPIMRSTLDRISLEVNELKSSKDAIFYTRLNSGAQNRNFYGQGGKRYNYVDKGDSNSFDYKGGFVDLYGADEEEFSESIKVFFEDALLDEQMQTFVVEYITYNSNYNSFTSVVVTFTNSLSGLFESSLEVNIVELEPYTNYPIRAFLEISFILFTVYYAYLEFKFWIIPWREANKKRLENERKDAIVFEELLKLGVRSLPSKGIEQICYKLTKYLKFGLKKVFTLTVQFLLVTHRYLNTSFFRVINFCSICLSFVTIIQLLMYLANDYVNTFDLPYVGHEHFTEFRDLVELNNNLRTVLAFNLLIIFLRLLQFFKFSKKLSILTDILGEAKLDIAFFLLMFIIILFAYSLMGFLLLGHYNADFRTLGESFVTCYNMLLGEFDTDSIVSADSILGSLFFVTFMILFNLLLLNMFIAIIGAHFDSVTAENQNEQVRGFFAEIVHVIRKYWRKKLGRVHKKKVDVVEITDPLENVVQVESDLSEAIEEYDEPRFNPEDFSPNLWVSKLESIVKTKTSNEIIFSKMIPDFMQNRVNEIIITPSTETEVLVLNEEIWKGLKVQIKLKLWRRMSIMWEETVQRKRELAAVKESNIEVSSLSKLQQRLWSSTTHEDKIQLWIGKYRFNDEERIAIWNITKFSTDNLRKLARYDDEINQDELIASSTEAELEAWATSILQPIRKLIVKFMNVVSNEDRLQMILKWEGSRSDERLLLWAGLTMFEKQQMYLGQHIPNEALLLAYMILNDIGENVILVGSADTLMSQILDSQIHNKYFELAIYEYERHGLAKCNERNEDQSRELKNTQNYLDYVNALLKEKQAKLRSAKQKALENEFHDGLADLEGQAE